MFSKKTIILSILFSFASYPAQSFDWQKVVSFGEQMTTFAADKALRLTLNYLPDGVFVDYDTLNASITQKKFTINNLVIKTNQPKIKNQTTFSSIEVLNVDVMSALSGKYTDAGTIIFYDGKISDSRIRNDKQERWEASVPSLEINNFSSKSRELSSGEALSSDSDIPFESQPEQFLAKRVLIKNLDTKHYVVDKKTKNKTTKKYKAKNIEIYDLVVTTEDNKKINNIENFIEAMYFSSASVDGNVAQEPKDILGLLAKN